MKILHVIPSVSPVRGGPSQAVLEMVWALRQQGVDAAIATTNDDGDQLLSVPLNQWVDYPVDPNEPTKTVPVRFFARCELPVTAVREFALSFSFTMWLWKNLANYDVMHAHAIFSYVPTAAMAIARTVGVPYIVRPLGQLCHWSLQQGAKKKQNYLRLIERTNLQQAAAIHFTALQERQEAAALELGTDSFILPHGLNLPEAMPNASAQLKQWLNLPEDVPVILFLSRIHPKKGLEVLIEALSKLRSQPFRLVIAGSGTAVYEQQIQHCVSQANLDDRTHFVGFVKGEAKQMLLQGADLFALPSHSENFGIAVLEAMAAGLPTLITPAVGLSPIVQQQNLGWVVPQTQAAVEGALQAFLQEPQAARSMGERAVSIVQQQFTWTQVAQQLAQHYHAMAQLSVPATATA
ncbi:glycosyltransferase [filamentous cyanobacterium LEGE 11480]|uniref:Glycosyltransferase n=1 Tax=Romeriopsis navalis LEGE 11480 TaxID=2777977 RepID=A0A928Z395_9CYAN|nr:glycosyltransferase [Romeriopsis navalis]MBE9029822.1 glycosyltransferase [Romeriopsis navalis LEGE 11480]